jgi:hypothetical protein
VPTSTGLRALPRRIRPALLSDTDGDNQADIAFSFTFSEYEDGKQTGTAWYVTGAQARQAEPGGEILAEAIPVSFDGTAQPVQAGRIRLFAGLRSEPFFADVEGALHYFGLVIYSVYNHPGGA